jgi:hypothetical protein
MGEAINRDKSVLGSGWSHARLKMQHQVEENITS